MLSHVGVAQQSCWVHVAFAHPTFKSFVSCPLVHDARAKAVLLPSIFLHVGVVQHSKPSSWHQVQSVVSAFAGMVAAEHTTLSIACVLVREHLPQFPSSEQVSVYMSLPGYTDGFCNSQLVAMEFLKLKERAYQNIFEKRFNPDSCPRTFATFHVDRSELNRRVEANILCISLHGRAKKERRCL